MGVGSAATEVIDGHEYAVLDVYNSTADSVIEQFMNEHYYTKFVLQDNLLLTTPNYPGNSAVDTARVIWSSSSSALTGKSLWVILDLNGHTVSGQSPVTGFEIFGEHIEIHDSSAAGTGRINLPLRFYSRKTNLYIDIYGGTFGTIMPHNNIEDHSLNVFFRVHGGSIEYLTVDPRFTGMGPYLNLELYGGRVGGVHPDVKVPAYLQVDETGIRPYAYYAVSPSTLYSGVYNYEMGRAWELSVQQMLTLPMTDDQPYYLWGRNQNSAYEYLDLQYAGTQTVDVADAGVVNMLNWTYSNRANAAGSLTVNNEYVAGSGWRNTVSFNTGGGWEILTIPVKVAKHTDYALNFSVKAPDFKTYLEREGLFFGVTNKPIPENGDTLETQPNSVLTYTQIKSNYQGTINLQFNSGDSEVIYLLINGGYIDDGLNDVSFVFDNLQLTAKQNMWA